MIAREATLNDPEIVKLLSTKFIPFALDENHLPNLTVAEWDFLKSFDSGLSASTIGMSAYTAGGKTLCPAGGGDQPRGVQRMLEKALAAFRPEEADAVKIDRTGQESLRRPPDGGLVLYVSWKVLWGDVQPETNKGVTQLHIDLVQKSLGNDRLWVSREEAAALAKGEFPESLKQRMIRYHVSFALRGQTDKMELSLREGRLTGSFPSSSGSASEMRGVVEAKEGKVTRFELLVKGWGTHKSISGFSGPLRVIPEGKEAPVALFFELADPRDAIAQVLPHQIKDKRYWK